MLNRAISTITGPVVVQVSGAVTDDGVGISFGAGNPALRRSILPLLTPRQLSEFGIPMQGAGVANPWPAQSQGRREPWQTMV